MHCKLPALFIFALALGVKNILGYKILGLFPYNGKSHFFVYEKIMKGLAMRGHEVHVLSHYPQETPLENYKDLSVLGSVPLPNNNGSLQYFENFKYDILNVLGVTELYKRIGPHQDVMKSEAVQKLLKSTERYDLIITESFITDMILGFVHKFNVPFIFLTSSLPFPWTSSLVANPQNPAFIPHHTSYFPSKMTFFQRFRNTFELVMNLVAWHWFFVPTNQKIMDKYFGEDTPPLLEIAKNVSLMLTNTHSSMLGGRPTASNLIEIGGIHIEPAKKLPHDIEKFIEDSEHGVIYFCVGSMLRAATMPERQKTAFLDAFSRLKERVLWKFEDESLPTSDKIMIKKWMPQRDILAHPKVKLFISHGGLLGSLEAVSEGKPILGIPFYADQSMNVRALELRGVAKHFNYGLMDNDTLYEAIQEILKPKYTENAKQASKVFHDRPMSPMDTAIYWIEYVIRNRGAKHLRSIAVDLPYYQYLLLDVVAFSLFCTLATFCSIYFIFRMLCRRTIPKNVKKKLK